MALPTGFLSAVETALPAGAVLSEPEDLRTYECDGLTGRRVLPALVCLVESTEQAQAVVRACNDHRVPFVAR
jgi:glycolate oxidase